MVCSQLLCFDRAGCCVRINQLIAAADQVIFIRHNGADLPRASESWQLVPELTQPAGALYIDKTACDSFWRTELAAQLALLEITRFVIAGCATDYCVDVIIKAGATLGYQIAVAADAHTTSDRTWVSAEQQINQYNEIWADLIVPDNPVMVLATADILQAWRAH